MVSIVRRLGAVALALGLLLGAGGRPAAAQALPAFAVTCGTSSTPITPPGGYSTQASPARVTILRNPATSGATVWVNASGAAATAGPPSIDVAPGAEVQFGGPTWAAIGSLSCIAGTPTTVTVVWQ